MSAIPAPVAGAAVARARTLPVALSLGRVEAGKLIRHPASIVGALLGVAITVVATWHHVPVLNRYDAFTHEALIPFACGVFVAAHLGTMRVRRSRTNELFESFISSEGTITAAQLVAVLGAVAVAMLLVAAQLAFFKAIGGVTSPRLHVLLMGPAFVAFGGSLGVALGRWLPRLFAPPLALAGIVAICIALSTNSYENDHEWLSLWVPSEVWNDTIGEISLRPYAWRLLFFSGLAAAAAAIAFARHRRRRPIAMGVALSLVVATGFVAVRQFEYASRAEQIAVAQELMDSMQHTACQEVASVEYCPYPGYESWIELWRQPVEGVLSEVPPDAHVNHIRVAQIVAPGDLYDEDRTMVVARRMQRAFYKGEIAEGADVIVPLSWGRNRGAETHEFAVALSTAMSVTGIDTRDATRRGPAPTCRTLDQGRAVVAIWLAAQATPGAAETLERAVALHPYISVADAPKDQFFTPQQWSFEEFWWELHVPPEVAWGTRDAAYALALLRRPDSEATAAVTANWDRLTDPATTSDEAAAILGLPLLPELQDTIKEWKTTRRYMSSGYRGAPDCR